jgi:hypothetical protein
VKLERAIQNGTLVVDIDDRLAPISGNVLDALVECDRRGPAIAAGGMIAFGWVTLAFEQVGPGVLAVREPKMTGAEPGGTQLGMTDTVRVLAGQAAVCQVAGAEAEPAWFTQELIIDNEALTSSIVYLRRGPPSVERDCGFYLGCADRAGVPDPGGMSRLAVWQLFARRPVLVTAMALPVGYSAVFMADVLTAVIDARGKTVFQRAAEPGGGPKW